MKIPIACTLDAAGAQGQVDEWRAALRATVLATERPSDTVVRMRLRDERGGIETILALAQREVGCCAFFRFAIEIDARGVALTVTVPDDAAGVLDSFASFVEG